MNPDYFGLAPEKPDSYVGIEGEEMNCFNHRAVPAVGLCKSCGRALCGDCLAELTNGLASKNACESRVNMLNRLLDSRAQVMSAARHQTRSSGFVSLLLGIGSLIFAVWAYQEMDGFLPYFLALLGVACLASTNLYAVSHVVGYDAEADLILLKIDRKSVAVALGDDSKVETGERVFAIGCPEGLEGTISEGIVSSVREVEPGFRVL